MGRNIEAGMLERLARKRGDEPEEVEVFENPDRTGQTERVVGGVLKRKRSEVSTMEEKPRPDYATAKEQHDIALGRKEAPKPPEPPRAGSMSGGSSVLGGKRGGHGYKGR